MLIDEAPASNPTLPPNTVVLQLAPGDDLRGLGKYGFDYSNRVGHPAEPVLERNRERDIHVLYSPSCGALGWHSTRPAEWTLQREQGLR
jgi:hypothetical protein